MMRRRFASSIAVLVLASSGGCQCPLFEGTSSGANAARLELARRGIEIDIPSYRMAVSNENHQVVQWFHAVGFTLDHPVVFPATHMEWACALGNIEIVKMQIEGGRDPNKRRIDNYPLLVAASFGHTNVLEYLLNKGADPGLAEFGTSVDGTKFLANTPLAAACARGHWQCARMLVNRGAAVNGEFGALAVERALCGSSSDQRAQDEIVDLLLQKWNGLGTARGQKILESVCAMGNAPALRMLLKKGAEIQGDKGARALAYAIVPVFDEQHLEVARVLLDNGVDPTLKDESGFAYIPSIGGRGAESRDLVTLLRRHGWKGESLVPDTARTTSDKVNPVNQRTPWFEPLSSSNTPSKPPISP